MEFYELLNNLFAMCSLLRAHAQHSFFDETKQVGYKFGAAFVLVKNVKFLVR
jgi:hypothetical protein